VSILLDPESQRKRPRIKQFGRFIRDYPVQSVHAHLFGPLQQAPQFFFGGHVVGVFFPRHGATIMRDGREERAKLAPWGTRTGQPAVGLGRGLSGMRCAGSAGFGLNQRGEVGMKSEHHVGDPLRLGRGAEDFALVLFQRLDLPCGCLI
jgi:hypothetical protein